MFIQLPWFFIKTKLTQINRTPIVKKDKEIWFGWSLIWVSY